MTWFTFRFFDGISSCDDAPNSSGAPGNKSAELEKRSAVKNSTIRWKIFVDVLTFRKMTDFTSEEKM